MEQKLSFCESRLRTFGNCNKNYERFKESGEVLSKAKDFKNCIHPVLIDGKESELIIDKMILPELHLFEGAVNHIVENLEKKWSAEKCLNYMIPYI